MSVENLVEDKEQAIKITISKDAGAGLSDLLIRVNDGFHAGRVHRQDIASWIISKFVGSVTDTEIQEIRMSHYDEAVMLESLYRKAKETGEVPAFLKEALRKQFEVPDNTRKPKKPLAKMYISDVHLKNEESA